LNRPTIPTWGRISFFKQYGNAVHYSAATKWLVYNGMKWDENEIKAHGLAQELNDRQLAEIRKRMKKARAALDKAVEYLNYRSYCDEVGDYKRSAAKFKNEMLKAGYKWHKSKTGSAYYGIRQCGVPGSR